MIKVGNCELKAFDKNVISLADEGLMDLLAFALKALIS